MAKQNYQTRDSATDEIQPRTYAFLKHFHKFPVELADLQAQFEKLQDITNQLAGIPKISTTPHDINRHFDSNENLDVALLKFKSGREHNLDNINCNVSSPSNSELENNDFVELGMNELLANKVFDVLPEQDDNSYDNAEMVIYDDYKLIDVVQLPCELQKLDCYELEGEEVYATKVFEGLSESNIVADEVVFDDYDDDSHLSAHDLFVEFPYKEKCSGLVQDEVQYDEGEADYVEQVLYDKHDTTTSFFGDGGTSISTLPPFHLDVPPLVYGVEEEETCAATILVEADISYFESSDNQLVVDTEFASITLPNKPTGLQHYMDSKCIEYLEEGVKLIMLDIDSVASELMAGNKSVDEAIHDYISKLQFQNSAATFCHDNTCAMENLYRVVGHMHFIGSVMHFLVPNQKPHANSHASKQRSEWERSNEEGKVGSWNL